jgi:O-antigen ligase
MSARAKRGLAEPATEPGGSAAARLPGARGKQSTAPFWFFCLLVMSTLLHLGGRVPLLGLMRIDLLLALGAVGSYWLGEAHKLAPEPALFERKATKRLLSILIYVILTLPFVEWPGSVIKNGLEPFLKAMSFYFLVIWSITSTRQLRTFLGVYVACQVFRVMEPLYLHIVYDYWGDATYMGEGEFLDRLSGAPLDIVNPNGLAYIIVTTLPLLYFIQRESSFLVRTVIWAVTGAMIYALVLTASRSGFVLLGLLVVLWAWRARNRALAIAAVITAVAIASSNMTDLQKDRYLSIYRSDVKGHETAQGRWDGMIGDFQTAMRRPLFGHGLGTSVEVNAHYRGYGQISHNLYTEIAQELGFVGLAIFLAYVGSAIGAARHALRVVKAAGKVDPIVRIAARTIAVLLVVNIVFSFASYGLAESHWYLLAGLAIVIARLVAKAPAAS